MCVCVYLYIYIICMCVCVFFILCCKDRNVTQHWRQVFISELLCLSAGDVGGVFAHDGSRFRSAEADSQSQKLPQTPLQDGVERHKHRWLGERLPALGWHVHEDGKIHTSGQTAQQLHTTQWGLFPLILDLLMFYVFVRILRKHTKCEGEFNLEV